MIEAMYGVSREKPYLSIFFSPMPWKKLQIPHNRRTGCGRGAPLLLFAFNRTVPTQATDLFMTPENAATSMPHRGLLIGVGTIVPDFGRIVAASGRRGCIL